MKRALNGGNAPTDSLEKDLFDVLSGGTGPVNEVVRRAHDVFSHTYKREVIESFLLVGVTPKEIEEALSVDKKISAAYAHLFFDPTAFEDDLDRLEYAQSYSRNEYGSMLKKFAVDNGKSSLLIRMSRENFKVSPTKVQNEVRATAYMLAQRAKSNPIDSDASKEAYRWAKLALHAALEADEDITGGIEEITIALKSTDETVDEESSGINADDILR